MIPTTDLLDEYPELGSIDLPFQSYGSEPKFEGWVRTVYTPLENRTLRNLIETPGDGAVVVADGGGWTHLALIGDRVAQEAVDNGWKGMILNGQIRDWQLLSKVAIGIKALGITARRSPKEIHGTTDIPILVGGIVVSPGDYLWSDEDGVVVAPPAIAKQILA